MTGRRPHAAQVRAIEQYMILTIDHGFNASTFTARVITSTGADLAAAIVGAIGALSGPLHGGAPSRALDMLDEIGTPDRAEPWIRDAVKRGDRIMGFGHRVYKTDDPRSRLPARVAKWLGGALVDFAAQVERTTVDVLAELKPGRELYTNVEFFAGVVMHTCGIPREMFTPTFAAEPDHRLGHPRHGAGGRQPADPPGGPLRGAAGTPAGASAPDRLPTVASGVPRAATGLDFNPLKVELPADEPPGPLPVPIVVDCSGCARPDRSGRPIPLPQTLRPATRWWATHVDLAPSRVALHCISVDSRQGGTSARNVGRNSGTRRRVPVTGAGDGQREVVGKAGERPAPRPLRTGGRTFAVQTVGRGGVGDGQLSSSWRAEAGSIPPACGHHGSQAGPPLVGSETSKRSAKADISSSVRSRSGLIEAATTSRVAPAASSLRHVLFGQRWAGSRTATPRWRPGRGRPPPPPGGLGQTQADGHRSRPSGWNPSPRRPARRAAASLCPPMWMGTPPGRTGLGKEWALRKETNSPSNRRPTAGVGPQSPHGLDGLVGAATPGAGVGAGGPQFLVHPAHSHAHPDPATRKHIDGGDPSWPAPPPGGWEGPAPR